MKSNSGHTLLELVVAMGIFSIMLASVFNIFVPGLRVFMVGRDRASTQANVLVALKRIKVELCSTSNSAVTINSADIYAQTGEPDSISFLSPYPETGRDIKLDYTTSTLPVWQKYVVYYFDRSSSQLRRKIQVLPAPSPLSIALTHQALYTICTDDVNYTYSIVAREIYDLSICRTSPYLVKISISSKKKGAGFVGSQNQESKSYMEIYPHNTTR